MALIRLGNFATAEQLQSLCEEIGLTRPPYERYVLCLSESGALQGKTPWSTMVARTTGFSEWPCPSSGVA
jgi:hypothetical protein